MNGPVKIGFSARTLAPAAVLLLSGAGQTLAQPETRTWLLPQSGLWSDPLNWSDANVPDTALEIASISPPVNRGTPASGGLPEAIVDGAFEVYRVAGNGSVNLIIPPDSSLSTRFGVRGENENTLRVQIGIPEETGEVSLNLTNSRAVISASHILMAGPAESTTLSLSPNSLINNDVLIEGRGTITGDFSNSGVIRSMGVGSGSNTLTLRDSQIDNRREIIGGDSVLDIERSEVTQNSSGSLVSERTVYITDSSITGGSLVGNRSTFEARGQSSLDGVHNDGARLSVEGTLTLKGPLITNDGSISFRPDGHIVLEEDFEFVGTGSIAASGDQLLPPADLIVIINGPGHSFRVWDTLDAGLINKGSFSPHRSNALVTHLTIDGPFRQSPEGEYVMVAIVNPAPLQFNRLLVRGDVELDGTLLVEVVGNMDDIAGTPLPIIEIEQDQPLHTITGEFAEVELAISLSSANISPIAGVTYHPERVDLTLFCIADLNRNGSVAPSDFSAWVAAFNEQSPLADTNTDGIIDTKDLGAWLTAFNSGCGR